MGDHVERTRRRRRGRDGVDEDRLEILRRPEQHFALVGEVAKEGAFRQPGARGDVLDGRAGIAALDEQFHRRALEPLLRAGFPSGHGPS